MATELTIAGNKVRINKTWDGYREFFGDKHPTWLIRIQINNEEPFTFSYHDSIMNGKKDDWAKEDWIECLFCALQDAVSYDMYPDMDSFCYTFGYSEDKAAKKAFYGCQRMYFKFLKSVYDKDIIRQMLDYIDDLD